MRQLHPIFSFALEKQLPTHRLLGDSLSSAVLVPSINLYCVCFAQVNFVTISATGFLLIIPPRLEVPILSRQTPHYFYLYCGLTYFFFYNFGIVGPSWTLSTFTII